jgi:hypothetical protein
VDRPDVDGQALQLALGELGQAMRRAEVMTLFKLVFSLPFRVKFTGWMFCCPLEVLDLGGVGRGILMLHCFHLLIGFTLL